jgi:hypothetical protein
MKVEPIIPIDALHGKLYGKSDYYFRSIHGKQFAQRCPVKKRPKTATEEAKENLFGDRARKVATMLRDGLKLTRKEMWKIVMKQ